MSGSVSGSEYTYPVYAPESEPIDLNIWVDDEEIVANDYGYYEFDTDFGNVNLYLTLLIGNTPFEDTVFDSVGIDYDTFELEIKDDQGNVVDSQNYQFKIDVHETDVVFGNKVLNYTTPESGLVTMQVPIDVFDADQNISGSLSLGDELFKFGDTSQLEYSIIIEGYNISESMFDWSGPFDFDLEGNGGEDLGFVSIFPQMDYTTGFGPTTLSYQIFADAEVLADLDVGDYISAALDFEVRELSANWWEGQVLATGEFEVVLNGSEDSGYDFSIIYDDQDIGLGPDAEFDLGLLREGTLEDVLSGTIDLSDLPNGAVIKVGDERVDMDPGSENDTGVGFLQTFTGEHGTLTLSASYSELLYLEFVNWDYQPAYAGIMDHEDVDDAFDISVEDSLGETLDSDTFTVEIQGDATGDVSTTKNLDVNEDVSGYITPNDTDWYSVSIDTAGLYRFETLSSVGSDKFFMIRNLSCIIRKVLNCA